jgi:predicted methyltransferase
MSLNAAGFLPRVVAWCGLAVAGALPAAADTAALLDAAVAGAHRSPANRARDVYRHPAETLRFFGLESGQTVVEIWPAAGWYSEILAPVLREKGTYYAAVFVLTDQTPEYQRNIQGAFLAKLKAGPELYDRVQLTELGAGRMDIAPAGAADLVLTFRNVHNWMKAGFADEAFAAFFRSLKPGGVLGVVEHRAKPGTPLEKMIESGYVTEEHVIALAARAGFVLEARSEINANPADTTDHPLGVWTLPPAMAKCREIAPGPAQDECRKPYQAIGESDRMTLRFRKPAA